jgi:hypothetical protein
MLWRVIATAMYMRCLFAQLDKVYNDSTTDGPLDENERYEEMNRMREEVFKNMDKNKDELISLDEFLAYTKTSEFTEKDDDEWKTIEDEKQFDANEFADFEHEYYDDDADQQPGEVPVPVDAQRVASASTPIPPLNPNAEQVQKQPEAPVAPQANKL